MPRKRESLFPLLLPAILLIPLGGVLAILLSSSWHAKDAEVAVSDRLEASLLLVGRELEDAVQLQRASTEMLSQSPTVRLWMQFEGLRRSRSNRAHSATALQEVANYGKLLPGAAVLVASEARRDLYQDIGRVRKLSSDDPADAWYFSALKSEGVEVLTDSRSLRTASRVSAGARVLGAVACVSDVSSFAARAFSEAAGRGMTVVLTDSTGAIVRAEGAENTKASTILDLYPAGARAAVRAAMDALSRSDQIAFFTYTTSQGPVRTAAVRTQTPGWYIFISERFTSALPARRIELLAGIFAATLLLLLLALGALLMVRRRLSDVLIRSYEEREKAAREGLDSISAAARGAESSAERLASTAEQIAKDSAGAQHAVSEAASRFDGSEETRVRVSDALTERSALLARLSRAVQDADVRTRGAQSASAGLSNAAARAEEELSRVIVSAATASRVAGRLGKGIDAMAEAAERTRMLSLNASIEAARAGEPGRQLANVAEEIRGLAEHALERARSLSASLAELSEGVEQATRASDEAGRAVHEAAARATEASRAIASSIAAAQAAAGEYGSEEIGAAPSAGPSPDFMPDFTPDFTRSALAGLGRIVGRVAALAKENHELAVRAGAEARAAAETAEKLAGAQERSARKPGVGIQ